MPGFTIPDGLIYERRGDQPLISLTGGDAGEWPILAEQVQDLFVAQRGEIGSIDDRLAAVEAAVAASRWRTITEGTQSGGTTVDLAVPAGYKMLRLWVHGDTTESGATDITLNVNNDGGNNHVWGLNIRAADGTTTSFTHSGAGSDAWRIGRWGTVESNNSLVRIFPTDGAANPSYLATAHRDSTTAAGHQIQHGQGKFLGDVVVSSLRIGRAAGAFGTISWVLEGFLAPP